MPTTTWPELPTATTPDATMPGAQPGDPKPRNRRLRVVLTRYLALAVVLLALVFVIDQQNGSAAEYVLCSTVLLLFGSTALGCR
jgi:hypothetical protein